MQTVYSPAKYQEAVCYGKHQFLDLILTPDLQTLMSNIQTHSKRNLPDQIQTKL